MLMGYMLVHLQSFALLFPGSGTEPDAGEMLRDG